MDNDIVLLRETLHNLTKRLEINDTIIGISQKYYGYKKICLVSGNQ